MRAYPASTDAGSGSPLMRKQKEWLYKTRVVQSSPLVERFNCNKAMQLAQPKVRGAGIRLGLPLRPCRINFSSKDKENRVA